MILSCNSCEKKFVVPDNAITAVGRLVQCSSCGNKWNQFPVKNKQENIVSDLKINDKKIPSAIKKEKITKFKKKSAKKIRQINLYSPEYLAKKHGIKIGENKVINYLAQNLSNEKQVGTALFNVTPEQAGQYFTKIECFCFHDLMLEPGEEIKLPVSFYIDPEIIDDQFLKDLSEVTLSYTFYKNADTPIS